ncbi:MAG: VWA domain-containing protein [Acidobacteria bacterium]|nr:VWA domain-containing protein [Acidobacteriota bacterium]
MKSFWSFLILAALATPCFSDSITYVRVDRPLIQEHLKLARDAEGDRIQTLRNLLKKSGCPQVIEQEVPKEEFPNLICLMPGEEEGTIVVGASSDYAAEDAKSPGQWGTLALLPLLAESIAPVHHRFTLILIAFTGHEHGLRGASWYLSQLTEDQRKPIKAMVSLDNLGNTAPVYALAQADKTLANWLQVAAFSLQFPTPALVDASTSNLPLQNGVLATKDEDLWGNAKPFEHEHIPAIALQSARPDMLPTLQRSGAIPSHVTATGFDMDAYEATYRLLAVYVLYLDRNLDRPWVEPGTYAGKLVDTAGLFSSSPLEVSLKIDRFTTGNDLFRYERILQQGGQDALADALAGENEKGHYRFGLALAYSIKVASLQSSGKAPYVLLVGTRIKPKGSTVQDFRFTAIKLMLDSKGVGSGLYYNSVKLRFNKRHELEISDSASNADDIRQVALEQPKFPKTTPATAMASAAAAGSTQPGAGTTTPAGTISATSQVTGPIVASATAPAGTTPPPSTPSPDTTPTATFHSQARLVQLDVAVTDSNGRPVLGLQQSDFTVIEDGKPQEIRAFESHAPGTNPTPAAATVAPLALPPHTFTNQVTVTAEGPLNILLLDLWNTPVMDQAYARKQTIKFLKELPKGRTLAMFVLGNKLQMVQGFTDDAASLLAAAEKIMNERSLLLRTDAERQSFQGAADDVGRVATPTINAPGAPASQISPTALSASGIDLGSAQARNRSNTAMEADRTSERVFSTLNALSALARAVSSYPGRKNLIWLSGSFPIRLNPAATNQAQLSLGGTSQTSGLENAPNFPAALRTAAKALATARIAVYPMDVRGIQVGGVDPGVGASESASFAGTENPGAFKDNMNTQSATRYEEHSAMQEMADQTGGELLNGNDVRAAIGRAIEDGATYYAIAYTPTKSEEGQQFRKIVVKLNRKGVKMAYRPGYFPSGVPEGAAPKTHPLIVAMQPGVPPSTVVPLTVEVLPPDSTNKKTRIRYTIDIRGIEFTDTAEHRKRAVIDCIAVAFSKEGAPVGQISNTTDATLPMADYEAALRSGLVVPQELELPPGDYILRLGVMDHGSQKIGTLDAPLAVVAAK